MAGFRPTGAYGSRLFTMWAISSGLQPTVRAKAA